MYRRLKDVASRRLDNPSDRNRVTFSQARWQAVDTGHDNRNTKGEQRTAERCKNGSCTLVWSGARGAPTIDSRRKRCRDGVPVAQKTSNSGLSHGRRSVDRLLQEASVSMISIACVDVVLLVLWRMTRSRTKRKHLLCGRCKWWW